MTPDNFSPYFDPDHINIDKDTITKLINAMLQRWKKNKKNNKVQIMALQTFKLSLHFQSDETINEIMKSIVSCVNEMQQYNAMMRLKKEFPTTSQLTDIVIAKIEKGDVFHD